MIIRYECRETFYRTMIMHQSFRESVPLSCDLSASQPYFALLPLGETGKLKRAEVEYFSSLRSFRL